MVGGRSNHHGGGRQSTSNTTPKKTYLKSPSQAKSMHSLAGGVKSKPKGRTTSLLTICIEELRSQYYDCSSYKEAERYITTTKMISQHVGRTFKDGGDIRATIDNMVRYVIPLPVDPATNYTATTDSSGNVLTPREQVTYMEDLLMKQEVGVYVKRKASLDTNIQKAYSLVLGQCTELLKNKLKAVPNWVTIKDTQDVLFNGPLVGISSHQH